MDIQAVLNRFATDVFRRQADFDYVAARASFRMQLRQQFLWSSQQAIEKYLKAILLFNGKSARAPHGQRKEFGHDLKALLDEVRTISAFSIDLEPHHEKFILYLAEQGPNRYLSRAAYNTGTELRHLDGTVWHVRRYCQYFSEKVLGHDGAIPRVRTLSIEAATRPEHKERPQRFSVSGGELEKIIRQPAADPARRALVWANLYYGSIRRTKVSYRAFSSSELPPNKQDWLRVNWQAIEPYVKL